MIYETKTIIVISPIGETEEGNNYVDLIFIGEGITPTHKYIFDGELTLNVGDTISFTSDEFNNITLI